MKIEVNKVLLVLAVAVISSVYGDWSWGNNGKALDSANQESIATTSVAAVEPVEEGRNAKPDHQHLASEVLPLEEHSSTYDDLSTDYSINTETELDEEGRAGRFLGISNKLCKIGVKGLCEKQDGYPPAGGSHYGNSLGSSYGSYAPQAIPVSYEEYPPVGYPDLKAGPPKKPFTKIFSDIFNPKKSKGSKGIGGPPSVYGAPSPAYGAPSPAYGAPSPAYGAPSPAYGAPSSAYGVPHSAYSVPEPVYGAPLPEYIAPQPSYAPPVKAYPPPTKTYGVPQPKPHYHTPQKPYVEPKPVYSAPKPVYKETFQTYGSPKPADVLHHKVLPLHTHVVEPSKVQHLHTHTHIYNSPVGSVSQYGNNFPRDDGIYQATSDVKSTVEIGTAYDSDDSFQPLNSGNSFQSFSGDQSFQTLKGDNSFQTLNSDNSFQTFNNDKSFQSFNNDKSFQTFNNDKLFQNVQKENFGDSFKPSQAVPFIDAFSTNQGKRQVKQETQNSFNNFGAKEQAFQTSINELTSSFANNGISRAYPVDCQCVPHQYCAPEDLIARTNSNDIGHLLDARNEQNDILSNATSELATNATLPLDYYDYDYLHYENAAEQSEDNVVTTVNPDFEEADNETSTTEKSTTQATSSTTTTEAGRVRRSVNITETEIASTTEGLSGRQLTGFSPGASGCGHDHVCCRRPVYVAAQRTVPTCGRGNPSIHGRVSTFEYESGQADFGEYPWQAAILREEGSESMFVCGATLIDNLHVLTAAHCVNDLKVNTLKVRLGEWDVNRDTEFYKHVEIPVASVIVHPEFYKGNLYNDIAIVRMADFADIDSSPHIAPVCLPTPGTDFTNYRCHVTGWGKDAFGDKGNFQHILKELEIPVINRKSCEHSLRSTRLGEDYKLHEGFMCAGGEEGKDACKGDGGGPLVCSAGDKSFQLAGIVSWGVGCGQQGIPGVYVNIPYYVDWIRSVIQF